MTHCSCVCSALSIQCFHLTQIPRNIKNVCYFYPSLGSPSRRHQFIVVLLFLGNPQNLLLKNLLAFCYTSFLPSRHHSKLMIFLKEGFALLLLPNPHGRERKFSLCHMTCNYVVFFRLRNTNSSLRNPRSVKTAQPPKCTAVFFVSESENTLISCLPVEFPFASNSRSTL